MIRRSTEREAGWRRAVRSLGLAALLLLAGCAQMDMGQPQVSMDNQLLVRNSRLAPVSVGSFAADPRARAELDEGVKIRTNALRSPFNGSLAAYLRETLLVELKAAGLFSADSPRTVTGVLLESSVDSPVGVGKATLAGRFTVQEAGRATFERTLRAEASWDSPFVGVVAIPIAAGQYEALYRKLIGMLLADQDFRKALTEG
ncbi:hypothetical protein PIGHUM_00147 [Pigmentiphaga humi]|uniref:ABC-type transport auxiliary lipoprotein component domain-containing protein n=1 Tax=Pigmentiphaga humi TaxID=2478468 RepID=A0A3P4AVN7_9BURK|nr:hypothetical protein [Pigmentiphaga humi]VCU68099.1 hypothetical protein PIGHUM_00147 [Pigmentiphaga humi]